MSKSAAHYGVANIGEGNTSRNELPVLEYLVECLVYDFNSGMLFWKERPRYHFSSNRIHNSVNSRLAGKKAFTSCDTDGYYRGSINGVYYAAHRVCWKLHTGKEPPQFIDHKDRNPKNNCWANLRAATQSENFINRSCGWGKSGMSGIRQSSNGKKWEARIHYHSKYIHIGTYDTKEEAAAARDVAAKEYYGEFVP